MLGYFSGSSRSDIQQNGLLDGLLLPANGIDGGDSAIKPDSWARIKASFSQ